MGRAVLEAIIGRPWPQAGKGFRIAYANHSAGNLEVLVAAAVGREPQIWWRWPCGEWRHLLDREHGVYNVVSREILEMFARDVAHLLRLADAGGAR